MTKKISFIISVLLIIVILGIGVGVVAKQAIDKKNQEFFDAAKNISRTKWLLP